jgi:hypothetical protein
MKPDELLPERTISIRLPSQLATDLRRAAEREANPDSVVARRLIATGLRELGLKSEARSLKSEARSLQPEAVQSRVGVRTAPLKPPAS